MIETIDRPTRWDVPFGREVADDVRTGEPSDGDIARLVAVRPFSDMKSESFPKATPLEGILRNDARLRRFRRGDVIVRQGDYGNSAFLILSGSVRVVLSGVDSKALGRGEQKRKSIWRSLMQVLTAPKSPESRDSRVYREEDAAHSPEFVLAQDVTNVLNVAPDAMKDERNPRMRAGQLFGELAALGRIPRAVTVVADEESELLEIRWQGLRDLMKFDPALRTHINEQYRKFGLAATLQASPLLRGLTDEQLQRVASEAVFETYGQFDWYGSYKQLRGKEQDPLSREPVIAAEGNYPNGIVLIRAGFARLSRVHGHGERTLSYLGKGDVYGLAELTHNARSTEQVPYRASLRAIGYVDVVRIPTRTFEELILPHLPADAAPELLPPSKAPQAQPIASSNGQADQHLDTDLVEFLVEHRVINGTATMLIDLDRCTRCDDCVRACAGGHENNPRFIRHGPIHDHYMVANACMHCVDPVCMIGCPTGAIHRDEDTGNVVINDLTCIGCQVCAASCPYNNIRMVEVRDRNNDDAVMVDPVHGRAIVKATKCDLCGEHHGGPACQRACPHDALQRVDMWDEAALGRWLKR